MEIQHQKLRKTCDFFNVTLSYANKNRDNRKSQDDKKINDENQFIRMKIQEQKKNKLTIAKLKKQFQEHDRLVNHAKKIK